MSQPEPFYIVGVPRSGTTLLAVLLNSHSQLHVGKTTAAHGLLEVHRSLLDSYRLEADVRRCTPAERLRRALKAQPLAWDMVRTAADRMDDGLRSLVARAQADIARCHGKQIWGDKSPFMLNQMPLLSHLMPGVRFVHVIRDGRAVAHSRQNRRGYPLRLAIHEWKRMIEQGRVDGAIIGPERYLEVKYEALLADPVAEMTRLCAFLGVSFEAGMLDLKRAESTHAPEAYVGNTLDTSKIDAWQTQLTARQIAGLEAVAGDLLQALGYHLLQAAPQGPFRALSPLAALWEQQRLTWHDLFEAERTTMINQQMVQVSPGLRTRVRRFLRESASQVLSEQVLEHFRRRKVTAD